MATIDDTDREILDELERNGRATYQEIAERVGLSGPAVSKRVDQLQAAGIIRGFSVDVDRSILTDGELTHIVFRPMPTDRESLIDSAESAAETERVYQLDDGRIVVMAWIPPGGAPEVIESKFSIDMNHVESLTVVSKPL